MRDWVFGYFVFVLVLIFGVIVMAGGYATYISHEIEAGRMKDPAKP